MRAAGDRTSQSSLRRAVFGPGATSWPERSLEPEYQSKLNQPFGRSDARLHRCRYLTEAVGRGATGEAGSWWREVRVVKDIEELCPELDFHSLVDRGPLKCCKIEIVDTGRPKSRIGARLAAKTPVGRGCKAGSVKPLGNVSAARRLVTSRNHIGTNIGDPQVGSFQRGRASVSNLQREATLECGHAVNSPARNHAVRHSP